MARRPTPQFRIYEQQTTPQAQAMPMARSQDVSSGGSSIGQSLMRAGQAVENYSEAQTDIMRIEQQRREDDARVLVAQRMADVRREASELRRTVFDQANNGWEGATDTYGQQFNELRERHLSDEAINTPEARTLFEEQLYIFEQGALDAVATEQQGARVQWQADAMRQTVDQGGNVLAADPSQYEAMREDMLEALAGVSDANLRRDTTEYMEEGYARYAVAGLIQANPREALRALQDPEAEGAYSRLSPAARIQAQGQAEAEIERRAARWRAQVSQSRSAAEAMWELGLAAPNAPSVETVRQAEGDLAALRYEAMRLQSTQFGRLAPMSAAQLQGIVADTNPRDNQRDAVLHEAERRAAASILEQRQEDPMQYQVRHGLTQPADLIEAFNGANAPNGDWGAVWGILNSRSASAEQNSQNLGVAPLPLTAFEANVLGPRIRGMTIEQRGAFMRNAAAWMGRDSPAYANMMAQLFPDSPATAYAGYITGAAGENGARDAQLILRGQDILGGRSSEGGENGSGGRSRLLQMPDEDDLRREFRNYVGDAYASLGGRGGAREAEAQAYEAYRSAYAALAEQSGSNSDAMNRAHARRAAQIASGGIVVWNGRETLTPPGMSAPQFSAAVRDGFSRYQQLQGQNPRDYTLMPLGPAADGRGFRYGVFDGDDAVRSPSGRPVEIEVRRR